MKEICFNLNNLRIKDGELGPLVNKDLSKRVRCVPQFLRDREVMKHDTSMVTKLISSLDARWKLWQDTANINTTTNPLLANVHDFLGKTACQQHVNSMSTACQQHVNSMSTALNCRHEADAKKISHTANKNPLKRKMCIPVNYIVFGMSLPDNTLYMAQ